MHSADRIMEARDLTQSAAVRLRPRASVLLGLVSMVGIAGFCWPLVINGNSSANLAHSADAPWLFVAILPLLLAVVFVPFLQPIFNTHALTLEEWQVVLGLAVLPAVAEEITKWVLRRRG